MAAGCDADGVDDATRLPATRHKWPVSKKSTRLTDEAGEDHFCPVDKWTWDAAVDEPLSTDPAKGPLQTHFISQEILIRHPLIQTQCRSKASLPLSATTDAIWLPNHPAATSTVRSSHWQLHKTIELLSSSSGSGIWTLGRGEMHTNTDCWPMCNLTPNVHELSCFVGCRSQNIAQLYCTLEESPPVS